MYLIYYEIEPKKLDFFRHAHDIFRQFDIDIFVGNDMSLQPYK